MTTRKSSMPPTVDLARRALAELTEARRSLEQLKALLGAIEIVADADDVKGLAQIGEQLANFAVERSEIEGSELAGLMREAGA